MTKQIANTIWYYFPVRFYGGKPEIFSTQKFQNYL